MLIPGRPTALARRISATVWKPRPPSSRGLNLISTSAILSGRGSLPRVAFSSFLKRLLMEASVVEETSEEKEISCATLFTMNA